MMTAANPYPHRDRPRLCGGDLGLFLSEIRNIGIALLRGLHFLSENSDRVGSCHQTGQSPSVWIKKPGHKGCCPGDRCKFPLDGTDDFHMKRSIFIPVFILFFIFSALLPSHVFAAGWFSPRTSSISLPANIVVPGNADVGAVLWTSTREESKLLDGTFAENSTIWGSVSNGTLAPGFTDVYETNIPGLGVRWWAIWRARNFPSGVTTPITSPGTHNAGATGWQLNDSHMQTIWIELIKTGPIQSGKLSVGTLVTSKFNCAQGGCRDWQVTVAGQSSISAGPTCSVSTPAIPVSMGNIATTTFTGMGATSPPRPFTITLACSGGAGYYDQFLCHADGRVSPRQYLHHVVAHFCVDRIRARYSYSQRGCRARLWA